MYTESAIVNDRQRFTSHTVDSVYSLTYVSRRTQTVPKSKKMKQELASGHRFHNLAAACCGMTDLTTCMLSRKSANICDRLIADNSEVVDVRGNPGGEPHVVAEAQASDNRYAISRLSWILPVGQYM